MSKITAIKQQVKKADRYSIFVDGAYSFSLNESELISSGIHSGQELTKEQLNSLKETSKLDKIYGRVINLISRRPRSVYEIESYLKRHKYEPEQISAVTKKCLDLGLLDDKKFAQSWVESRRLLKPTSRKKLRLELRQKGIASDLIDDALTVGEISDVEVLRELIERKQRQTKYHDELKLMQYLARQGFNYSDIKQALQKD